MIDYYLDLRKGYFFKYDIVVVGVGGGVNWII